MEKKNIISLSGEPASGKGAVSKFLMDKLNFGIYRNGEYFRSLAKEANMDLEEFSKYVSLHPEIDIQIENSAKEYALENDNFIIDARLGWYAVPESFKVYLKVDIDEAARRAFADKTRNGIEVYQDVNDCRKSLLKRYNEENKRYFNVYGVKKEDPNNYDLVVDTTKLTPLEVSNIIIEEYTKWKRK